jgi:hypothetical protein
MTNVAVGLGLAGMERVRVIVRLGVSYLVGCREWLIWSGSGEAR